MFASPLWRLLFNQRLMIDTETPKSSETSFLLSWNTTIHFVQHLQSQIPRIGVHGEHSHAGSLLKQTAVGRPDAYGYCVRTSDNGYSMRLGK